MHTRGPTSGDQELSGFVEASKCYEKPAFHLHALLLPYNRRKVDIESRKCEPNLRSG